MPARMIKFGDIFEVNGILHFENFHVDGNDEFPNPQEALLTLVRDRIQKELDIQKAIKANHLYMSNIKVRGGMMPYNVQIEGQPASGLSLSNAGLCVNTTERGNE